MSIAYSVIINKGFVQIPAFLSKCINFVLYFIDYFTMVILYLHGMASSHESFTAACVQKYMPEATVLVPDLSVDPEIAFPQIQKILEENKVDIIVGHSLGGFMAQKFRGYKKILLNPSLGVTYFRFFKGDNKYKHNRYDGKQTWHIDDRICKRYKEMEHVQYDGLTKEEDELTLGMFGRWDFMTRMSSCWFLKHYSHRVMIPGGHFLKEETVRDYLVPGIKSMFK